MTSPGKIPSGFQLSNLPCIHFFHRCHQPIHKLIYINVRLATRSHKLCYSQLLHTFNSSVSRYGTIIAECLLGITVSEG